MLFLDPTEVENCFVKNLYFEIPQNERVIKYDDYLVDNYISEDCLFAPAMWASCCNSTERTTNTCESFHSQFNASFYESHPDIYKFICVKV